MASPVFNGCCAPGEVLFFDSLLHVLWPCCNSCPATINSSVTTLSFICYSLNYFHSFHPLPFTFLKTPWMLLCLLTTFLVSCPASGKNFQTHKPKLFSLASMKGIREAVLYLWNFGGSVKAKLIQAAWTHRYIKT